MTDDLSVPGCCCALSMVERSCQRSDLAERSVVNEGIDVLADGQSSLLVQPLDSWGTAQVGSDALYVFAQNIDRIGSGGIIVAIGAAVGAAVGRHGGNASTSV